MRFARILCNSVVGGVLVAAYVLILILHLNPSLSLGPVRLGPLALRILIFYGAHAAVAFCALILVGQMVIAEPMSPGWVSVGLLAWTSTVATAAGALAMWLNLRGFTAVLEGDLQSRLVTSAIVLSACGIVFLGLALYSASPRRRGWWGSVVLIVTITVSIAVPLIVRGRGREAALPARRLHTEVALAPQTAATHLVMLLVDGASLDFISPAAAEGRLPNFGRMLDSGAVMHLATLRPTQPEAVWTALATGKLPYKNGIRSAASYGVGEDGERIELLPDFCFAHGLVHFGLLGEQPHVSRDLSAQPFWGILGELGISSGIVNWALTHPVQPVRGYLIADQLHSRSVSSKLNDQLVYPPDALAGVTEDERRRNENSSLNTVTVTSAESDLPTAAEAPFAIDSRYQAISADLQRTRPARVMALRYQGLDAAGHYFLRFAVPRAFGDVSEPERRAYGRVLEQYYTFIDAAIGRAMASLSEGDLLLVISPFGMEPLSIGKRLLERAFGNPRLSGSHERAPDGFLLAYGSMVAPGRLTRASVLDVTPSILYFLGLPVARDMDGYARTDIFERDFTAERPITFIPTYEQ